MDTNTLLDKLKLDQLIRYAFGGGLLIFFAYICRPDRVGEMIESMGVIFAPLFILGLGIVVYGFQRKFIGEYLWYPILHKFHHVWDKINDRNDKKKCTSPMIYLKKLLKIKDGKKIKKKIQDYFVLREAYTTIRRLFDFEFPQKNKLREKFDIAHAELHVLWITIDILILFYVYIYISGTKPEIFSFIKLPGLFGIVIIFIIILVLILGVISAEIHQFQYECRIIKKHNKYGEIEQFLQDYKFINVKKGKK